MRWLVTGGAGCIGAHVGALLCDRDDDVVVLDDLSTAASSTLLEIVGSAWRAL